MPFTPSPLSLLDLLHHLGLFLKTFISISQDIVLDLLLFSLYTLSGKCHPFWFLKSTLQIDEFQTYVLTPLTSGSISMFRYTTGTSNAYVPLNPSPCQPPTHAPPTLCPVLQHHLHQVSRARWLGLTFDSYSLISIESCPSTPEDFSPVAFLTLFLHPDLPWSILHLVRLCRVAFSLRALLTNQCYKYPAGTKFRQNWSWSLSALDKGPSPLARHSTPFPRGSHPAF